VTAVAPAKGRRRRGSRSRGSGVDWELFGGLVIVVLAILAAVALVVIVIGPGEQGSDPPSTYDGR
jgi:hypothetical protein